ncbi:ATP/GTP-binding protein [Streptomyces sp. NPDC095602]|uniref:ATP/GTP-binding protein n=1 Tax=Streptomyces sp. NPDC095602 TaxID=3155819 RepID=UPI0033221696
MDPRAALSPEGTPASPDPAGEYGEESDEGYEGEYETPRSLADRIGDWLDYRIALGNARLEAEGPYREAEIARKVTLLKAQTDREIALLEQHNKLREAQLKSRADRAAAQGKGGAGGGKSPAGMGTDKGGRGNSSGSGRSSGASSRSGGSGSGRNTAPTTNGSGGTSPKSGAKGPERPSDGRNGPSGGKEASRHSKGRHNGSDSSGSSRRGGGKGLPGGAGSTGGSKGPSGRSGSSGSGTGSGDRSGASGGPGAAPERARGRQERAAARQAARNQRRAARQAADLNARDKYRDQTRQNKQAERERKRADKQRRREERQATKNAAPDAASGKSESTGADRTTLGEAFAEEAQQRWDKRRQAPDGSGQEDKAEPGRTHGVGQDGDGGPGAGPEAAPAEGGPIRVESERADRPHQTPQAAADGDNDDDIPDAEIVDDPAPASPPDGSDAAPLAPGAPGLPAAPEPSFPRPGTTRPTPQESSDMSSTKAKSASQRGLAREHRTDITFDEYVIAMANLAVNSALDGDAAQAIEAVVAQIATALQEMSADLAGDHNITSEITNLVSQLADTVKAMKAQAKRCAEECGTAAEAAALAATEVARVYGQDIQAMDDSGLQVASAAAHHE